MSKVFEEVSQLEKKHQTMQLEYARYEERKKQLDEEHAKVLAALETLKLSEMDLDMTVEELKTKIDAELEICKTKLNCK